MVAIRFSARKKWRFFNFSQGFNYVIYKKSFGFFKPIFLKPFVDPDKHWKPKPAWKQTWYDANNFFDKDKNSNPVKLAKTNEIYDAFLR